MKLSFPPSTVSWVRNLHGMLWQRTADWLAQTTGFISSWFWRLGVQAQGVGRVHFFWEAFSWMADGRLPPLSSQALLCVCVCPNSSAYKDTSHIGLRPTLMASCNLYYLFKKSCVKYSEVRGVRTSVVWLWWGTRCSPFQHHQLKIQELVTFPGPYGKELWELKPTALLFTGLRSLQTTRWPLLICHSRSLLSFLP